MKNAPLYTVLAYVAVTFGLLLLGPVTYHGFNPAKTSLFLGATVFSMFIGYKLGLQTFERSLSVRQPVARPPFSILPLFRVCLALAIAGLLVSVIQAALGGTLNLSAQEIGQAYVDGYADYERNTGTYSLTFLLYSVTLAPSFVASVWGLFYFRRLSLLLKLGVVFLIVGTLWFYTIGSGKQKQLGDTIIFVIAVGSIAYARSGRAVNFKILIPALIAAFISVIGFISILSQRYTASSIDAINIIYKAHPLQSFNLDHPIFELLGYDIGFATAILTGYLSAGYFGLSLALDTDPTWSYMIGFSYSLTVLANRFLGLPWVIDKTYPYIVGQETGWGASKWHSVFPHWASDFTFPGTVILFGFFAYVFARCWRESVEYENPFAILLYSMLVMGAFFIPANNQLFISPGSLVNVLLIVTMYLLFHKRFNHSSSRPVN